jgi:2,4-dienoyl-CoA reductase-like NADH-dependent reductase (Old Yellow Enzyme family)
MKVIMLIPYQSNIRVDEYSCTPSTALRLLRRIVTETRAVVPGNFVMGLKINSADYAESYTAGHASASPVLDHILTIANWGSVDFIEISGGDYETPGKSMSHNTK